MLQAPLQPQVKREFGVLENAAEKQLELRMRKDEQQSPDLRDQCKLQAERSNSNDCQMYRDDVLRRSQYIPLPEAFRQELNRMNGGQRRYQIVDAGIFPEINRVWIIGDNKLWLWNYLKRDMPYEIEECPGFGTDRLLAVAMCVPRPGVFVDEINYLLVVATDIEVVLVALQFDPVRSAITPIRTDFCMSLDNVVCKKIVCSQYGRVFVAGHDGSLTELEYEMSEPVSAFFGIGGAGKTRCRKRKHNCWDWRLTRVLPSFVSDLVERMEDMAIDNVRNILYTASFSKWWTAPISFRSGAALTMQMLFLGESGRKNFIDNYTGQYVAALPINVYVPPFDLFEAARAFCQASKNADLQNMCKRHSDAATLSREPFSEDMLARLGEQGKRVVVGMHVVPVTESSKVHLVVVLSHGFRVYLRIVAPTGMERRGDERSYLEVCRDGGVGQDKPIPSESDPKAAARSSIAQSLQRGRPARLEIVFIRPPPVRANTVPADQSAPMFCNNFVRGGQFDITIQRSYYSQGVFLAAIKQGPTESLLSLTQDLKNRSARPPDETPSWSNPSMREALCAVPFPHRDSVSEVRDIAESAQSMHFSPGCMPMQMQSLFCTSFTPQTGVGYKAPQMCTPPGTEIVSETPMHPMPLLAPAGRALGTGVQRNALGQVVTLNECVLQHVPAPQHSLQRQLLVLESSSPAGSPVLATFGITVLRKRRPVDFIFEILCRNQSAAQITEELKPLYAAYGALEFCSMCIGIACGLAGDAGDTGVMTTDMQQVPPTIHDDVRFTAMKSLFNIMGVLKDQIRRGAKTSTNSESQALAQKVADGQKLNEKEHEKVCP